MNGIDLYLGLVHYPVYNKRGQVITSAVTNYDIHDIARAARTYGLKGYFIIHPDDSQAGIIRQIIHYWQEGCGRVYNPDRADALSIVELAPSIAAVTELLAGRHGKPPLVLATDAREYARALTYPQARELIAGSEQPLLLLFGTGWGIERETVLACHYFLRPIWGPSAYNHLSVRSAAAIILDRLLGM